MLYLNLLQFLSPEGVPVATKDPVAASAPASAADLAPVTARGDPGCLPFQILFKIQFLSLTQGGLLFQILFQIPFLSPTQGGLLLLILFQIPVAVTDPQGSPDPVSSPVPVTEPERSAVPGAVCYVGMHSVYLIDIALTSAFVVPCRRLQFPAVTAC